MFLFVRSVRVLFFQLIIRLLFIIIKLLIMQTIPKNGQYIQRRKLYSQLPFYQLNSKSQILDFHPQSQQTQELKRLRLKQALDHLNVKREYENKVQRMMQEKRLSKGNKTISIDQQIQKYQDTLAKQLTQFNTSKRYQFDQRRHYNQPLLIVAPNDHHDTNHMKQNIPTHNQNYSKLQEEKDDQYGQSPQSHQTIEQARPNIYDYYSYPHNTRNRQYLSQSKVKSMQYPNYYEDLQKQYQRYAQGVKGIPTPDHCFKNVIPDKLQNFLRDKVKADHRRSIDICVAPNRNTCLAPNKNKHSVK